MAVVSYASGRTDAPSLEAECAVLEARGASVVTDCLSAPGASGSPILTMARGRAAVVSVVSGGATSGDGRVTVAAGIGPQVAELTVSLDRSARVLGRGGTRRAGGAKFVTP